MDVAKVLQARLQAARKEALAAVDTLEHELAGGLGADSRAALLAEAEPPTKQRAWRETIEEWLLDLPAPEAAQLAQLLRQSRGSWLLQIDTPKTGSALLIGNSLSGTALALVHLGWQVTLIDNCADRLAIAKLRAACLSPIGSAVTSTVLSESNTLPFDDGTFDLVVMEEAPLNSKWSLRDASRVTRGAARIGDTAGMLAVTADNRLAYKVSTGTRGEFRLVRPLPFLKRALLGDQFGRPHTPTSSRTLAAHRRAFRDLAHTTPRAVSLYPDRRDFAHVVDLQAPGTLRLTIGPKERANRIKMLGHSLGLFPLFTPSFALWSPVTQNGIVPARSSSPTACLFGRILAEVAGNFGAEPPRAEHLIATRGNTALIQTAALGGAANGWVIRVPLGHRPTEAIRLGLRHTNWLGGRFPRSKLEALLPRPLHEGNIEGVYVTAETRLPGFGAGQLSGDADAMGFVYEQAAELLAELQTEPAVTIDQEAFDELFGRAFDEVGARLGRRDQDQLEPGATPNLAERAGALPGNLAKLRDELRELVIGLEIPRVAAHNDLRPKHIIVQTEDAPDGPRRGTITGIVDWACLTPNGLPLFDLVHLILQERASCSSSRQAWEDLQNPASLTQAEEAAISAYCAALALPDAWRKAICLGYPILFGAVAERHWEYSRPHWLRRAFGI
ncbi:MAG: phosphotransferase [Planctomycetota bacterium]|nr:phosphotransferase [Planctomycetota bacterium]